MFKHRRAPVLTLAAACAAAALCGCGASATRILVTTVTVTATPTTSTFGVEEPDGSGQPSPATAGGGDCDKLLHTNARGKVLVRDGTCLASGVKLKLIREGQLLRIRSLSLRVAAVRTAKYVTNGGQSLPADGRFVIVSLHVTNTLPTAQIFDGAGTETELQGHRAQFDEDYVAENGNPPSCVSGSTDTLEPGKTERCQVIFDVPVSAVTRMRTHGAGLVVTDFGVDVSSTDAEIAGFVYLSPLRRS